MDSYLELFTSVYGWTIANLIYSILLDTGIVFIPLIVTVVSVWSEAHILGAEQGGVEWAIRKMEVELYTALFVMSLCFVPTPFTTLDRSHLLFKPDGTVTTPNPPTVNGAASGTSYDAAFGATASSIPVPVWWYTVMGLSSGVNAAVRAGVANQFLGLRQAEELARLATIEDPQLRSEAQMFRDQCWTMAVSKFHDPAIPHSSAAATGVFNNQLYGKDDTEWIGSRLFQIDPAYYQSIRARQPINGFPLQFSGDDSDAKPGTTGFSIPNCLRWWTDPDHGLRGRLLASGGSWLQRAPNAIWGTLSAIGSPTNTGGLAGVQDQILKQALWKSHSNYVQTDQVLGGKNSSRWELPELASGYGIAGKGFEATFSYYPVTQFLLMAQPLVLMGLYIFLPLIVLFSRFSLQFMMYGALAIFTVKFWAAMWSIAKFVDERLVVAMYGDDTILLREYFVNGLDGGAKRAILNALTLGLFIGLPMVWSGMMAWVGFKVGAVVDKAINSAHSSGASAGSSTTAMAGGIFNKVGRAFLGGIKKG